MNKDNVFRSQNFFMATGDVLHMIIRDETGNAITFNLVSGSSTEWEVDIPLGTIPGKPVVLPASDITLIGFTANWQFLEDTNGFYLDVAIDSDFTLPIAGYANLDVGSVNTYDIVGLSNDTPYYYRIRAYNDVGTSINSDTVTLSTLEAQPFVDIDGNPYTTIVLGNQEWTIEPLRTTHYSDGTAIPLLEEAGGALSGWFLGSRSTMLKMYKNLWSGLDDYMVVFAPVGGFSNSWYQTSSEYSITPTLNEAVDFTTGAVWESSKNLVNKVRACRVFTAGAGEYSLRDTGPEGGLIFYISGTTYYEAAATDQADSRWSNITTAIGTTSYAIGEGQNNTDEIMAQAGHTDSAAEVCNDLSTEGWATDTDGAYCWYENNIANAIPYGAIYNHYAVSNTHGLAYFERAGVQETGWRVPTVADFNILSAFAGGSAVAGGKLKEVATTHWQTPNTGASDEYGFKAIPGGFRSGEDGVFFNGPDAVFTEFVTRTFVGFWSSTLGGIGAYNRCLRYNDTVLNDVSAVLSEGNYVRCVRDVTPVSPEYVTLTDGITIIRKGVRDSCLVVDIAMTPLGFAGVENTDWRNLVIW